MKNLSILSIVMFITISFFMVSCDPTETIINKPPTITESHSFDATKRDAAFPSTITLKAVKGDATLKSITIKENGVELDPKRFKVDETDATSSTIVLSGADKEGFTKDIKITFLSVSKNYNYSFTVVDDNQESSTVSLDVNVIGVKTYSSEKVYNIKGPLAGGLDISTGKSVVKGLDGANEWAGAHLLDEGNDVVGNTYPWKGSITPWGGSIMKATSISNADFIAGPVSIFSLYDNGQAGIMSLKLTEGKFFTIKNGDNYYLLKVKTVFNDGKSSGEDANLDYSEYEIITADK